MRRRGISGGFAVVVGALVALGACQPANAPPRTVSLRMRGTPARATVTIDDRIVGSLDVVAARGVALPEGKHRISVEAEGFFPWDRTVDAADAPVMLDVNLQPLPE